MSDLNALFVTEKEADVLGAKVKIKQVTLGDLPKLITLASKHFSPVKKNQPQPELMETIKKIVTEDFATVCEVLASITNIPAEKIPSINIGAATLILHEIVKENLDFLQSTVIPAVNKMAESMTEALAKDKPESTAGSTKSKN